MAGTCPMTAELWQRFLEGRLNDGEREILVRHLEEECADCERFFVDSVGPVEAAGISFDNLLKELEPGRGERDKIFRGIANGIENRGRLPICTKKIGKRPLFSLRWYAVAPVALALVVVAVVAFIMPGGRRYDGTKGADLDLPAINLQVAVLRGNGSNVPERGIPQETYQPGDTLIFRYELGANGYVYFLKADSQSVDLIDPANHAKPAFQPKGVYEFREGGAALGYPLKRLRGQQIFIAVASKKPMNVRGELEPLVRSFIKGETPAKAPDWAIDSFRIAVEGRAAR